MVSTKENNPTGVAKWGWRILLTLSSLLALNGIVLYFFIADSQLMRTASIMEVGLGLLALVAAWEGFSHGSRWARNALWVLVGLLATMGIHILLGGSAGVSAWYLGLAAFGLVGQLLAARSSKSQATA